MSDGEGSIHDSLAARACGSTDPSHRPSPPGAGRTRQSAVGTRCGHRLLTGPRRRAIVSAVNPDTAAADPPPPALRGWRALLAELTLARVGVALLLAVLATLLIQSHFVIPFVVLLGRMMVIAMLVLLAWIVAKRVPPQRLPRWLPRWLVPVLAIVLATPVATYIAYLPAVGGDPLAVLDNEYRVAGFMLIINTVLFMAPAVALGAMVRERDAQARGQALQFALEKTTLERQALDAELRLLQAQIQPHFLFNTLANVQALVESGSPRAAPVLQHLITYLSSATPRLGDAAATLGDEATLARAYLELMHMRMPDRLQFSVQVEPEVAGLRFPSMALLTLVENAVRHGIDPAEEGGRIDVRAAHAADGTLCVEVADTGVGLARDAGAGTGLANLRARLAGFYGAGARLELGANLPRGVRACITIPKAVA